MVSDPKAKEIIKELKIKPKSVRKVSSTVMSIHGNEYKGSWGETCLNLDDPSCYDRFE